MTLTTSRLTLPYPEPNDTVDVPRDIQALANRLDIIAAREPVAPLAAQQVLDVGLANQIRAGRQLAVTDFTAMGLAQPVGLWNLSNLSNLGSDARALVNKGTVPFGVGINGTAATAAQFAGSTAQGLYILDSGASDPYRIPTGSFGCWFKTAKRDVFQSVMGKWGITLWSYALQAVSGNTMRLLTSQAGNDSAFITGLTDVCDDRWHFVVGTSDGTTLRLYVDGILDAAASWAAAIFSGAAPLTIGGHATDATTATQSPFYGRVDEAFITSDVLSDDQVRLLYCARITHTLAVAAREVRLNVTRRRRGGTWAVADFPTQPLRLHNFTAAAFNDEGSNNVTLVWQGGVTAYGPAGADGVRLNALGLVAANYGSTDAGLPAALTARSFGLWFKTAKSTPTQGMMGWGAGATSGAGAWLGVGTTGLIAHQSAGDLITGPYAADGLWHLAIGVEDNAAADGVKRKLYFDGRIVAGSTVMNSLTLGGANRFRVGSDPDGTENFTGQVDGVFVCGYALTTEQIASLYAKGTQALALSPKNPGDHVEAMDATSLLATFDTLDSTALIDMGVQA